MGEISWLAEYLLVSQERLCFFEWEIQLVIICYFRRYSNIVTNNYDNRWIIKALRIMEETAFLSHKFQIA
jgi:hypothetical protein